MPRTLPDGSVETTVTRYVYDNNDRIIQTIRPDNSTFTTVYGNDGRVEKTIDAANRVTQLFYDLQGRQTSMKGSDGVQAYKIYDTEGRLYRSISPRGLIAEPVYDSLNRMIGARHRDGNRVGADGQPLLLDETFTAYDDAGQVISITDERNHTTYYTYDATGRSKTVTDARNSVTQFFYDEMGRRTKVVDALNQATRFEYDELGRQFRTINPLEQRSTTEYDETSRVVARTDAAGRRTQMAYDGLNRLLKATYPNVSYGVTYTYDEMGNKLTQTDANNHTTKFAYDNLGRMVGRELPMGQTESILYRPDGRVASRTDFLGHTTTYQYDEPTGRLLKKWGWSGDYVSYGYTPDGMIATATRYAGSVNGGMVTTGYDYDVRGRVERVRSPTGTIGYRYDVAGNIDRVSLPSAMLGYEYDELNRLSALVHPGGARTSYTYNAVGNREAKRVPGGIVTNYGYDGANRLTSVTHSNGAGQVLASFVYTLDGSGRRQAVNEARRDPVSSLLQGNTTVYSYDGLGRLTGETGGIAGTLSYTYDNVGNRLSKTANGVSVGYTYNANDWMKSEGSKTFDYDANGNTIYADGQTLQYDWQDRLVATQNGGNSAGFVYDADGNRIQKIANGQVTSYLTETLFAPYAQVAEERDGVTGNLVARNDMGIDLARMDRFAAGVATGDASYYLHDGLGSTVALTNSSGVLTDTYGYDTFGNPSHLAGSTANVFLFNGQQYDEETGLYYLRARYYAPGQGRFLNHDPLMGNDSDPLSLHRYLYAGADPVNFVDPSGESFTLSSQVFATTSAALLQGVQGAVSGSVQGTLFGMINGAASQLFRGEVDGWNLAEGAFMGGANGALAGIKAGALMGALSSIQGTCMIRMAWSVGEALADWDNMADEVQAAVSEFQATGNPGPVYEAMWDLMWLGMSTITAAQPACFVEGTPVYWRIQEAVPTEDPVTAEGGSSDIKALKKAFDEGKPVWALSQTTETGEAEWRRVTGAFKRTVYELVTVELAEEGDASGTVRETITGTTDHPFFTEGGLVPMGRLGVGTAILTRAGPRLVVKTVRTSSHPKGVAVYNFAVDGNHTYFVGNASGGVWVHNADCIEADDDGNSYTRPLYAMEASDWRAAGGKIKAGKDGEVTYTDWEGHTITYSPVEHQGRKLLLPDFTSHKINDVTITFGNNTKADIAAANKKAGYADLTDGIEAAYYKTPAGYTWHHQDLNGRMILVPSVINQRFGHVGADSMYRGRYSRPPK
jgi:RHS repeat-associated protein